MDSHEQAGYKFNNTWHVPKAELPNIIAQYDTFIVRSITKINTDLVSKAKKLKIKDHADCESQTNIRITKKRSQHWKKPWAEPLW
jgi:hypothetical protein